MTKNVWKIITIFLLVIIFILILVYFFIINERPQNQENRILKIECHDFFGVEKVTIEQNITSYAEYQQIVNNLVENCKVIK